jgi:hypothetical protein
VVAGLGLVAEVAVALVAPTSVWLSWTMNVTARANGDERITQIVPTSADAATGGGVVGPLIEYGVHAARNARASLIGG